jgi:hypothetical protein
VDERTCWNCGHGQADHTIAGGCSVKIGDEKCDCTGYEDSEYQGEQRKRDLYRYSDMRRLGHRRQAG